MIVVYYESIKRELKIRCIYECQCDERLQTKTKEFTHCGVLRGGVKIKGGVKLSWFTVCIFIQNESPLSLSLMCFYCQS